MITWEDKVAFVGMTVETVSSDVIYHKYHVRVRIPGGACSYGSGHTMEKAIESAAWGMNMDWYSVERKITEREWERMSHM